VGRQQLAGKSPKGVIGNSRKRTTERLGKEGLSRDMDWLTASSGRKRRRGGKKILIRGARCRGGLGETKYP